MIEKLKGATRLASSSTTYGAGGVRRQREHDFGRVFTGLLFALFVATLLMAILAGTDVYRGLNREGDAADNQRLSLTLLANDVRANDQIDAVACAWVTEEGVDMVVAQGREELGLPEAAGASDTRCLLDGPALVLRETLPSGVYETRLYRYDGVIMEEYALADAPYDPSKATAIVRSSVFDFSYGGGSVSYTHLYRAGHSHRRLRVVHDDEQRAHFRAEHQVSPGFHRAIGAAHQRVDGRLADRDQAAFVHVRAHAFERR